MNNREIDRLIAEKVMDWDIEEFRNIGIVRAYAEDEVITIPDNFCPSESIEDAWEVVGELRKFRGFSIHDAWDEEDNLIYSACFLYNDGAHAIDYQAYAKTAPLAICKAALKSVGVEVSE
ncbi:BC1872 family protein [Paraliobacillus salinarum]|uniref:BC1872 family protein n=1 Tax=Paraliobacillus salinarum TaxID=1158996 RepID=UPI0015F35F3D|nr:hypothetical protein [Paraliobacillus salinarum]